MSKISSQAVNWVWVPCQQCIPDYCSGHYRTLCSFIFYGWKGHEISWPSLSYEVKEPVGCVHFTLINSCQTTLEGRLHIIVAIMFIILFKIIGSLICCDSWYYAGNPQLVPYLGSLQRCCSVLVLIWGLWCFWKWLLSLLLNKRLKVALSRS